jgi:hypothetical protein
MRNARSVRRFRKRPSPKVNWLVELDRLIGEPPLEHAVVEADGAAAVVGHPTGRHPTQLPDRQW